ncbi:MAG: hypothetical protein IPF70_18595 [Saprospiraceae bacterium]|nr:hypothetical protein [Saprospiraceae bacterium]
MLEHSRKATGIKEPTYINALCEEYIKPAYQSMRAKDPKFNCEIKIELDPDLHKVNVIAQDLGRVILNLVNNAFQACSGELIRRNSTKFIGSNTGRNRIPSGNKDYNKTFSHQSKRFTTPAFGNYYFRRRLRHPRILSKTKSFNHSLQPSQPDKGRGWV